MNAWENRCNTTIEPALRALKERPPYRQAGSLNPFFSGVIFEAALRVLPAGFHAVLYHNQVGEMMLDRESLATEAESVLVEVVDDRSVLTDRLAEWRRRQAVHDQYVHELQQVPLVSLPLTELDARLQHYTALCWTVWEIGVLPDCFDPTGEAILREVLAHCRPLLPAERALLVGHEQLSTEASLELRILQGLQAGVALGHLAQDLQQDFHWVENNYAEAHQVPVAEFAERIDRLAANLSQTARRQRQEDLEQFTERRRAEKATLHSALKLTPRQRGIVRLFTELTDWREERKRNTQRSDWVYQQFIQAIAEQTGQDPILLAQADPREHSLVFGPDVPAATERLQRRLQHGLVQAFDTAAGQMYMVDDPAAVAQYQAAVQAYFHKPNEPITGQVAMAGPARGRVCIVNHRQDFPKFQPGDILVSGMTRPELMPVIRQASGIITDEGGLTCHAAVISRELQIPCIIGTQNATVRLHDGDWVEFDGQTGLITLIKPDAHP
jgi:phosphohistidine swiveling domain-containing protein